MSSPAPRSIPTIAVLGGGTAGWTTACLVARAWPAARITVIESPEIGIIGVGEGSTPQLRGFFETVGLAERDWMRGAHATYKTAFALHGLSDRPGHEHYLHLFAGAVDLHTEPAFHYNTLTCRSGGDVPAHPDRFFLNAPLAERHLAPIEPEPFLFEVSYGCRFDAHPELDGGTLFNDRTAPMPADAGAVAPRTSVTVLSGGWARHLSMKVGRIDDSWGASCLAVGPAEGLIEPRAEGGPTLAGRIAFNAAVARRYERVRYCVPCRYRVNGSGDTAYRRDNAANDNLPDARNAVLTAWFTRGDVAAETERQGYAPLSRECLLAGYGAFPDPVTLRPAPDRVGLPAIDGMLRRCALNFPDHAGALRDLARLEAA